MERFQCIMATLPLRIRLQPKQGRLYDLLTATGPHVATTIGFGGAKGGGKSDAPSSVNNTRAHARFKLN